MERNGKEGPTPSPSPSSPYGGLRGDKSVLLPPRTPPGERERVAFASL